MLDVGGDATDGVLEFVAPLAEIGEFGLDIVEVGFGFLFSLACGLDSLVVELIAEVVALIAFVGQPLAAFLVALGE